MSEGSIEQSHAAQIAADRADRFRIIDELRAAFNDVPHEGLECEAERALAQVRDEMQREREQAAAHSQ